MYLVGIVMWVGGAVPCEKISPESWLLVARSSALKPFLIQRSKLELLPSRALMSLSLCSTVCTANQFLLVSLSVRSVCTASSQGMSPHLHLTDTCVPGGPTRGQPRGDHVVYCCEVDVLNEDVKTQALGQCKL